VSKVRILALAALVQIIEDIAAHDPDQLAHDRGCIPKRIIKAGSSQEGNFGSLSNRTR
jgi:hypothetical protein